MFETLTVYGEGISTLMGKCRVHGSRLIVDGGGGARFLLKQIPNSCSKHLLRYEDFGVPFVIEFIFTELRMEFQILVNFFLNRRWVNELLLNIRQKIHHIHQNYSNVLIQQLLHVSPFTVASSGSVQLLETIF